MLPCCNCNNKVAAYDINKTSLEIDNELAKSKENDELSIKILLLGAGESGKSTLFKQMNILYGDSFNKKT